MTNHRTAAMVVIGNEILSGKVEDSNSPFLAKLLREWGVSLERILVIPDIVETIGETVKQMSDAYDYVFTSGGVGPTHDDITIEGIARGFGVSVITHERLRESIASLVSGDLSPAHLKMAETPDGAELLDDDKIPFPTVMMRNVFILPGIPEIFESKVSMLHEKLRTSPYHLRQILVSKGETHIADYLNATLVEFPELLLGSYPKLSNPEYSVRLTLESKDETYVDRALDDLVSRMPEGYVVKIE